MYDFDNSSQPFTSFSIPLPIFSVLNFFAYLLTSTAFLHFQQGPKELSLLSNALHEYQNDSILVSNRDPWLNALVSFSLWKIGKNCHHVTYKKNQQTPCIWNLKIPQPSYSLFPFTCLTRRFSSFCFSFPTFIEYMDISGISTFFFSNIQLRRNVFRIFANRWREAELVFVENGFIAPWSRVYICIFSCSSSANFLLFLS